MAQSEPLCVYCRRQPIVPAFRPFCSQRCRMADLGRWLSEDYRVPEQALTGADDLAGEADAAGPRSPGRRADSDRDADPGSGTDE